MLPPVTSLNWAVIRPISAWVARGLLVQAGEFGQGLFAGGGQFADFSGVLFLAAIFELLQLQPEPLGGMIQVRHLLFDRAGVIQFARYQLHCLLQRSHTVAQRSV